jgi:mannan endo-1,4-beta-mannosidase
VGRPVRALRARRGCACCSRRSTRTSLGPLAAPPVQPGNGGPCADRAQLLVCRDTREFVKRRLAFATSAGAGSGALFAWDLWNELHPSQGNHDHPAICDFIADVGTFVRSVEERVHGRAHPQTVSVFGPELLRTPALTDLIFRHPGLDFASSHFYAEGTIDCPRDTVAPAVAVGHLMDEALGEIRDDRPFFESEHGPIHTFKDHRVTLPAAFDDEYFRHIQWAHVASGGAGGGMRWPNRHPHALTPGMREAQRVLAEFLPLVDWRAFRRRVHNDRIVVRDAASGVPLRLASAGPHTPPGSPPASRSPGARRPRSGAATSARPWRSCSASTRSRPTAVCDGTSRRAR